MASFAATVVLAVVLAVPGRGGQHDAALVMARVYDLAGLTPEAILVAQASADAALAPAGITVHWTPCPDTEPRPKACDHRRGHDIVVRIVGEHTPGAAARCGFAVPEPGLGGFVSVSRECASRTAAMVSRSRKMAHRRRVTAAEVLGALLAHEIAHILMPHAQHSPAGLFRAQLERADWTGLRAGQLSFLRDDIERLREAVSTQAPVARRDHPARRAPARGCTPSRR